MEVRFAPRSLERRGALAQTRTEKQEPVGARAAGRLGPLLYLFPGYLLLLAAAEGLALRTAPLAPALGPLAHAIVLALLLLHAALCWERPFRCLPLMLALAPAARLVLFVPAVQRFPGLPYCLALGLPLLAVAVAAVSLVLPLGPAGAEARGAAPGPFSLPRRGAAAGPARGADEPAAIPTSRPAAAPARAGVPGQAVPYPAPADVAVWRRPAAGRRLLGAAALDRPRARRPTAASGIGALVGVGPPAILRPAARPPAGRYLRAAWARGEARIGSLLQTAAMRRQEVRPAGYLRAAWARGAAWSGSLVRVAWARGGVRLAASVRDAWAHGAAAVRAAGARLGSWVQRVAAHGAAAVQAAGVRLAPWMQSAMALRRRAILAGAVPRGRVAGRPRAWLARAGTLARRAVDPVGVWVAGRVDGARRALAVRWAARPRPAAVSWGGLACAAALFLLLTVRVSLSAVAAGRPATLPAARALTVGGRATGWLASARRPTAAPAPLVLAEARPPRSTLLPLPAPLALAEHRPPRPTPAPVPPTPRPAPAPAPAAPPAPPAAPAPVFPAECPGGGYENAYPWGVCTWYAKAMRPDLPWFWGDWGMADNWGYAARACGFLVNTEPAPGAVIVFSPFANGASARGHVGYVEEVGADYVLFSECNAGFDSYYGEEPFWWEGGYPCIHRRIPRDRLDPGIEYIHGRVGGGGGL